MAAHLNRASEPCRLHDDTLRVLQFVRDRNAAFFDEIATHFEPMSRQRLRGKLNNLQQLGYLETRRVNGGKRRVYSWTGKAPGERKRVVDPALVVAVVDRLVPDIVPPRTMDVLFTNAEPDRRLPYRADAFDFLRCSSRIGDRLTPLAETHHDPR